MSWLSDFFKLGKKNFWSLKSWKKNIIFNLYLGFLAILFTIFICSIILLSYFFQCLLGNNCSSFQYQGKLKIEKKIKKQSPPNNISNYWKYSYPNLSNLCHNKSYLKKLNLTFSNNPFQEQIYLFNISTKINNKIINKWLIFDNDNHNYKKQLISLYNNKHNSNPNYFFSAKWLLDKKKKYHLKLLNAPSIIN